MTCSLELLDELISGLSVMEYMTSMKYSLHTASFKNGRRTKMRRQIIEIQELLGYNGRNRLSMFSEFTRTIAKFKIT